MLGALCSDSFDLIISVKLSKCFVLNVAITSTKTSLITLLALFNNCIFLFMSLSRLTNDLNKLSFIKNMLKPGLIDCNFSNNN